MGSWENGKIACASVEYISQTDVDDRQRPLVHSALRTLNGYIRYVRKQRQGRDLYGDHPVRKDSPVYYPSMFPPNEPAEELHSHQPTNRQETSHGNPPNNHNSE